MMFYLIPREDSQITADPAKLSQKHATVPSNGPNVVYELDAVETAVRSSRPRYKIVRLPVTLDDYADEISQHEETLALRVNTLEAAYKSLRALVVQYFDTTEAANPDKPTERPRIKEDYVKEIKKTADYFLPHAQARDEQADFGRKVARGEKRCRLGIPGKKPLVAKSGDDLANNLCSKHRRDDFLRLQELHGWEAGMEGDEVFKCL